MEKNIAVIWGDCSSPEIVKQTIRVLDKVAEKYGHTFHYTDAAMGGEAIDKYGDPLPQHELDKCLAADSVLLGAVGGPKSVSYTHLDVYKRQQQRFERNFPKTSQIVNINASCTILENSAPYFVKLFHFENESDCLTLPANHAKLSPL